MCNPFIALPVPSRFKHASCATVIVCLLLPAGCRPLTALGKNPSGDDLKRIEALPNYKNGEFQNLEERPVAAAAGRGRRRSWLSLAKYFVAKPPATRPPGPLPVVLTDLQSGPYAKPTVFWLGHSAVLLKTAAATVLFDPALSNYAGPFRGMVKAFEGTAVYGAGDMPVIDALVISHDHYDHLDYETVKRLQKKVKRVIVPVGVGSHFRKWGYANEMITELNWNDSVRLSGGLTITAMPAHHRSNRTFASRKTLWASYVVAVDGYKLYFSGDTGYSPHFKLIGERCGPFDLALLECGQYNAKWPQSHMFPFQTARAALELQASVVIPVHWGKFAESEHPWNEPVKLLLKSADSLHLAVSVPYIGQPYTVGQQQLSTHWWDLP